MMLTRQIQAGGPGICRDQGERRTMIQESFHEAQV